MSTSDRPEEEVSRVIVDNTEDMLEKLSGDVSDLKLCMGRRKGSGFNDFVSRLGL